MDNDLITAGQISDEFTLMSLFFRADLVVKLVILILFAASIFSWTIIIHKIRLFRSLNKLSKSFEKIFWSGKSLKSISLDAFVALGCNGWARVDLLQDKEKNFYVIEINTVPGMTSHSNVPKSGSLVGLTYNQVVQKIIDASL